MVAELFAHTLGVVKNGPFLPNYSGPIRVKWYRVIKLRRCIAKPKNSMIVCARTVTEEGMELSAVVIMCLNSAPKSAQVLPSCCLVLHLQCVLFLDVLLVAQPSGRRSTENKNVGRTTCNSNLLFAA